MMRTVRNDRGFTLIELLATIAISAILFGIGMPSFNRILQDNHLAATANSFVSALDAARLGAINGGSATVFCGDTVDATDTLTSACTGAAGAVYALQNDTAVEQQSAPGVDASLSIEQATPLEYNGNGLGIQPGTSLPYTGLVVDLDSPALPDIGHRCIYLTTGSDVTSCSLNTACPTDEPATCQ